MGDGFWAWWLEKILSFWSQFWKLKTHKPKKTEFIKTGCNSTWKLEAYSLTFKFKKWGSPDNIKATCSKEIVSDCHIFNGKKSSAPNQSAVLFAGPAVSCVSSKNKFLQHLLTFLARTQNIENLKRRKTASVIWLLQREQLVCVCNSC